MTIGYKAIDDAVAALKAVGEKHNVTFEVIKEKSRTGETTFLVRATANDDSAQRSEFERWCEAYGFKKTDYKRKFIFRQSVYTLVGFDLNKPKYAISAIHEDGRRFGFPRNTAIHLTWVK